MFMTKALIKPGTEVSISIYILDVPHAGSRVERLDPLHFLAGCYKRQLNQALSIICLSIGFTNVFAVYWGYFLCYISLHICMCSVSWLFWLSCQHLPSDWLERLWGSLFVVRLSLQSPGRRALMTFRFSILFYCLQLYMPHAGSRVVRIDSLHFLTRCRTRRLNQALSVLSLSLGLFWVCLSCC